MLKSKFKLTVLLAVCGLASAPGSALAETVRDSVTIHFRQSKIALDTTYMGNAEILRGIRERLAKYQAPDSRLELQKVEVVGGASPEGSVQFNEWLSHRRAEKIFSHLSQTMTVPDTVATGFTFLGRDWDGLVKAVEADPKVPYHAETLALCRMIASSVKNGEKQGSGNLARLKKLRAGVPYRYLYRNIFPSLRQSVLWMTYESKPLPVQIDPEVHQTVYVVDTIHDTIYVPYCPPGKPFYMAVKTNMLYDAAAIPNIGVEFYLGKNFSIGGDWNYAWWKGDTHHRYWRAYGGDLFARWWFGKAAHDKPLTGHHVGIYGQVFTYDFEFGNKGWMGGRPGKSLWDHPMFGGGVEYGYSLPVTSRLNIDFTIGLGYFHGETQDYHAEGNVYIWDYTKNKNYFGPTKAEISLVWLLGRGNYNKSKSKSNAPAAMKGGYDE